jgi:hypothetical protein
VTPGSRLLVARFRLEHYDDTMRRVIVSGYAAELFTQDCGNGNKRRITLVRYEKRIPTVHTALDAEEHGFGAICLTSVDTWPDEYDYVPIYRADVHWIDLFGVGVWSVTDAPLTQCLFPTLSEAIDFAIHRCDRAIEHYRRTGKTVGMSTEHSSELWRRLVRQASERASAMEEELEAFWRGR